VISSGSIVLIAGLSNTYGHYITTREEYAIQRYEGASTIYGPFTLEAYLDIYSKLVPQLSESSTTAPPSAPAPPDLTKNALSLRTGVVLDNVPIGSSFGKVLTQPNPSYSRGLQVTVKFQGANPRVSAILAAADSELTKFTEQLPPRENLPHG
jgi:neutral ceramidase